MFLTNIQQSVARFLSDDLFFKGEGNQIPIPVIAANEKSLKGRADAAMAKLGLCVIVAPMGGDYEAHNGPEPYFNSANFVCWVRENQQTNRSATGTNQPSDYVAEVCAQLLKNHRPTGIDGQYLTGSGIVCTRISQGEDEPHITAWAMEFTCDGGIKHDAVRLDFTANPLPGAINSDLPQQPIS